MSFPAASYRCNGNYKKFHTFIIMIICPSSLSSFKGTKLTQNMLLWPSDKALKKLKLSRVKSIDMSSPAFNIPRAKACVAMQPKFWSQQTFLIEILHTINRTQRPCKVAISAPKTQKETPQPEAMAGMCRQKDFCALIVFWTDPHFPWMYFFFWSPRYLNRSPTLSEAQRS